MVICVIDMVCVGYRPMGRVWGAVFTDARSRWVSDRALQQRRYLTLLGYCHVNHAV